MRYEIQLITDSEIHYLPGITARNCEQRQLATHIIYSFMTLNPDCPGLEMIVKTLTVSNQHTLIINTNPE